MRRTKKGVTNRSQRETYRTPQVAIDTLARNWTKLPNSSINGIVDLCAGDGRIGSTLSVALDMPWYGCDIEPQHPDVTRMDVFEYVSENARLRDEYGITDGTLYVMNPPYGSDRDSNGLYLHDRIIEHVCKNWHKGDELVVLYPDVMYASSRRQRHWVQIGLFDPLIQYRVSFRCAFERDDDTPVQGAMSSVSWFRWANMPHSDRKSLRLGDLGATGAGVTLLK